MEELMDIEDKELWIRLYARHINYFAITRLGKSISTEKAWQIAAEKLNRDLKKHRLKYSIEDLKAIDMEPIVSKMTALG